MFGLGLRKDPKLHLPMLRLLCHWLYMIISKINWKNFFNLKISMVKKQGEGGEYYG